MDAAKADRVAGVLLGQACGDVLGVPYEFGPPLDPDFQPEMVGGGPFGFAPGEYSDDTAMAVCIAEVAGTGADLTTDSSLDEIAGRFLDWAAGAKDVGSQTRAVFADARRIPGAPGAAMRAASQAHAFAHPGRVGNGALMRTAIAGLSRMRDRDATAAAARSVAMLTHADPLGLDSCVLWSEAVRVAVNEGRFDLAAGLDLVPTSRRDQWNTAIDEATDVDPRRFSRNGYTVWALQAAWAAITWTKGQDAPTHFAESLKNAVRTGDDTDTVAAIAGGLLGARWGRSAIPHGWQRTVHGYGDHRAHGLVALALLTATQGTADERGWPLVSRMAYEGIGGPVRVVHPHDDGVVLGSYASLIDHECDAVVSLCRIGSGDLADAGDLGEDHIEIRLIDSEYAGDNPHLDFVLNDAANAIMTLRAEGKSVLLHCVRGEQRTPAVAVAYSRLLGVDPARARAAILGTLPGATGRGALWNAAPKAQPLEWISGLR